MKPEDIADAVSNILVNSEKIETGSRVIIEKSIQENDSFVAYTPALDLSTAGNTLEEAQKNFVEAVNIFFEELIEMGTIDEVLTELGWQKNNNSFFPPIVVANQTESFSIPISN